ncbi:PA domain-containing protein [Paenibacillus sp. yr247]|uniref:M28 family peptidase n=1 Tax=Paenibacillus sp. yr247 TaxID=1761880 RepID=UPI00087FAF6C|nr:M28 family peptidase [Paenibacillus sp. yr247]SDN24036.1 PA domain-containing protein [Paenibacillus sp. yr247]
MSTVRTLTAGDQEMLGLVSKQHLLEFNTNIAKEVRLSGSEEELRAFKYVQNELDKMGFQTELLFYDAYISLPGEARLTVSGTSYNCITHSMLTSVQGLETEIVYVGRGHQGSLRKGEVEGKVLLVDGLAEADVVKNAEDHGAVGIIFINGEYTHEMAVSFVWGHPVPETAHLLPKIPAVSVTKDDGERIKAVVMKEENCCVLSTVVDTKFVSIPALTAEIQPDDVSGPFALFSGHIDSWHYGAMDNGSANSIMMEVARLFSGKKNELKRGLRLAFWSGHSHGRYAGSTWYCDTHWEELEEKCIVHINIDSSGGKGSIIQKANCMAETEDLGLDAIEAVTGERLKRRRMFKCADQSFWGTGTPSALYSISIQSHTDDLTVKAYFEMLGGENATGLCWWWHTTEDTMDKIDPECLVRDAKVYVLLMNRLLTSDIVPINQYKAADDIEQALFDWQQKAGDHFDLSPVILRIRELKEKLQRFQNLIDQHNVQDPLRISQINRTIMDISRILVPINYVRGSRFDHDPAIDLPGIPKLAEIDQLVATDPESDQYRFIHMSLRRKCNEILFAFKQAIRLLD